MKNRLENIKNNKIEKKEREKIVLWFVDDEEDIFNSYKRYLENSIANLKMLYFQKLEEAIKAIEKILLNNKEKNNIYIGDFFIIDGYLFKDEVDYQNGEVLVDYLRNLKDKIKQPYIIAFSSSDRKNKILKERGADFIYSKIGSNLKDLIEIINNPEKKLKEQN